MCKVLFDEGTTLVREAGATLRLVVERQTFEPVMRKTHGNRPGVAKRPGLTPTQLYGRLRKNGVDTVDS
jgi:DNA-binding NtrC family response regulator